MSKTTCERCGVKAGRETMDHPMRGTYIMDGLYACRDSSACDMRCQPTLDKRKADEKYLESQGWIHDNEGWRNFDVFGISAVEQALTIQRARDAAEDRAAWVKFAAAGSVGDAGSYTLKDSAKAADALLDEYRARFRPGKE